MAAPAPQEFESIKAVHDALEPLDEDARDRVISYISDFFGITARTSHASDASKGDHIESDELSESGTATEDSEPRVYSSFAELYDAVSPKTNGEKVLAAAYWLQVCKQTPNFTAASANKELAHLGHKMTNITDALDSIKNQKPSLVLQLKKSGTSRQARKTYMVTHSGIKKVEDMTSG